MSNGQNTDQEVSGGVSNLAGVWQPIETAPKDQPLLLFGLLEVLESDRQLHANLDVPRRAAGYWDEIDGAWSVQGGTWEGPWIAATHWMPLPAPPEA